MLLSGAIGFVTPAPARALPLYDSVHDAVIVFAVMSPAAAEPVVCICVRSAFAYIVPPAVVEDVPAPNGVVEELKFAAAPVVDIAPSPDAVVAGVVYEVTTAPLIVTAPACSEFTSILYVNADREFQVPANFNA